MALEKGLVVMFADLAPDRRIYASGGQARGLYAEMARNLSTRTKPDGGALASVVERFVSQAHRDAEARDMPTSALIRERLAPREKAIGERNAAGAGHADDRNGPLAPRGGDGGDNVVHFDHLVEKIYESNFMLK